MLRQPLGRDPGLSFPSLVSSPTPAGRKQQVTSQVRPWASQITQQDLGKEGLNNSLSVSGKALQRVLHPLGRQGEDKGVGASEKLPSWSRTCSALVRHLSSYASSVCRTQHPHPPPRSLAWRAIVFKIAGTGKAPKLPFFKSIPHHYADGKTEVQRAFPLSESSSCQPMFLLCRGLNGKGIG